MEFQYFMGIDVQTKRKCAYLVLNRKGICFSSGWLEGESNSEICKNLIKIIDDTSLIAIGIDAPRVPLPAAREFYFEKHWRTRREGERGFGRHCEVILKSLKIANPQFTPTRGKCPSWMELGFALFCCLGDREGVFEVFPAASYSILKGRTNPKVTIDFANFSPGPKDMIDACVSAITVLEYLEGRGCEVGGGDGLGSIILPGPIPIHPVLNWPNKS
jgi:predicted nuclease with RNAse H fold